MSGALGDPSTSYISLSAAGTGNVTGTGLLTASQVFLNSNSTGTIGAKTTAMELAAGAVTVTGGGLVNLSDSSGATLGLIQHKFKFRILVSRQHQRRKRQCRHHSIDNHDRNKWQHHYWRPDRERDHNSCYIDG